MYIKGIEFFFPQTLISNPNIFTLQSRKPQIFQTMNSVRLNIKLNILD